MGFAGAFGQPAGAGLVRVGVGDPVGPRVCVRVDWVGVGVVVVGVPVIGGSRVGPVGLVGVVGVVGVVVVGVERGLLAVVVGVGVGVVGGGEPLGPEKICWVDGSASPG